MAYDTRAAEIKVGFFVLVALGIFVVGSLWIAGSGFLGTRRHPYSVLMRNSAGVAAGDRVRMAGVSVGRIRGIELRPQDEWPVVLRIGVDSDITLHEDSSARIASAGLLDAGFLEIDPGTPATPVLPPGGEIRGSSAGGLEAALANVDSLSEKTIELLDQVSRGIEPILANLETLLSEENAKNVGSLLANLDTTMEDLGPRLSSLTARLESIADGIDRAMEGAPALVEKIDALIADLGDALGEDGARLAGVLDAAENGLSSADQALTVVTANREELEATMRDLRDTVSNLKAFSREVKERPYSLIRVKEEEDRKPGDGVRE